MLNMLTSRRSYKRAFAERPVDSSVVEKIVEVARWAPSAHNTQPWRYVVIVDNARRQALAEELSLLFRDDLQKSKLTPSQVNARVANSVKVFTGAPVLVLVCGETSGTMDAYPDRNRQEAETTMFVQSVANGICYFMLAAHACGLATSWYCAPLFTKATVREVLHLSPTWEPQAFVTLGYPKGDPIPPPARKPVEAILKFM